MADVKNKDRNCKRPEIVFTQYSPYMVSELERFEDAEGNALPVKRVMSLCRCGASGQKPFCDGSHSKIGFSGEKQSGRLKNRVRNYEGKNITIHDNRSVCSHDGSCIENLPAVFKRKGRPWIEPDGASVKEIIQTIEQCPSGALSYSIGERCCKELEREPKMIVAQNGPLEIQGGILLKDDMNSTPESQEHYTLCRCGASKNKPFCDGAHWNIEFHDET